MCAWFFCLDSLPCYRWNYRKVCIMKILDKAYWDNLVKLRDDMLNAYKKEIENAKKTKEHDRR